MDPARSAHFLRVRNASALQGVFLNVTGLVFILPTSGALRYISTKFQKSGFQIRDSQVVSQFNSQDWDAHMWRATPDQQFIESLDQLA
ncbi:MAG: hypothetical protein IPH31_13725 [Lewinellaceae bacterium]|nr:hypothetical protein [Lewinellaceae bacterium]